MESFLSFVNKDLGKLQDSVTTLVNDNIQYKNEIRCLEKRLRLSEGLIAQLRTKLMQQDEEILDLKCRSMRENVVIRGIDETPGETWNDTREKVVSFVNNKLQVADFTVNDIDRAHRLGKKSADHSRPIVAKINSADAKSSLFQNVKKLSGEENKKFVIHDQLPPEVQERRKRLMPLFKQSKENKTNKVSWSVDKLIVNGHVHSGKDDFQHINPVTDIDDTIDVKHTDHKLEEGSTFIGHAAEISKTESVASVLANILQDQVLGTATHNIYAYRIGRSANIKEGCRDDGEHGAGSRLLKFLREANMTNAMVVVSRFFGGKHMGPRRFEVIQECAEQALELLLQ